MILLSKQNFIHMKSLFNHPLRMLETLNLWIKEFEISTETCLENVNFTDVPVYILTAVFYFQSLGLTCI